MKTIATINFKGGVGKTTVTWCLGDVLSTYSDLRIILFDLDAQMSMTQAISLNREGNVHGKFDKWQKKSRENQRTVFSVLMGFLRSDSSGFNPDNGFIFRLSEKYHFVPSTEQLYWLELDNRDPEKGKFFIKDLLGKIENSASLPNYDYALFDCPPSFTLLSYSVLTCCDLILIPVNPDFFAAKGVELLITGLRERIKPHPLPEIAVFANRAKTYAEQPTKLAQGWINDIKDTCMATSSELGVSIHYLDAWLPDRVSIRDAITNRQTPGELRGYFNNLWRQIGVILK
ncbi:MAG: ParA family protein [Gammaproteobacteria bacterium]|nr:ParA family protein [Gammaproteobacteria bacterium]